MSDLSTGYPGLGTPYSTLSSFVEAVQAVQPFPATQPGSAPPQPQLVSKAGRDKKSATVTCQLGKRKPGRRLPGERRKTDNELCHFSVTANLGENGNFVVSAFKPHSDVVHQQAPSSSLDSQQSHEGGEGGEHSAAASTASSPALSTQSLSRSRHGLRDLSTGKFRTSPAQSDDLPLSHEIYDEPVDFARSSSPPEKFVIPLLPPAHSRCAHRQKRRRPSTHRSHEQDSAWGTWRSLLGEVQPNEQDEEVQKRRKEEMSAVSVMSGKGALRRWGWWDGEASVSEEEQEEAAVQGNAPWVEADGVCMVDAEDGPPSGDEPGRDHDDSDSDFSPEEPAPPKKRRKSVSSGGGRSRGRGQARASASPRMGRKSKVRFSEVVNTQEVEGAAAVKGGKETTGLGLTFSTEPFLPSFTSNQYFSSDSLHPGPIRPFDFRPPSVQQQQSYHPPFGTDGTSQPPQQGPTLVLSPLTPISPSSFTSASTSSPLLAFASPASSPETAFTSLRNQSFVALSPVQEHSVPLVNLSQLRRRPPPPPPLLPAFQPLRTGSAAVPARETPAPFASQQPPVETGCGLKEGDEALAKEKELEVEELQALEALLQLGSGGEESPILPTPRPSRWTMQHETSEVSPVQPQQAPATGFSSFSSSSFPQNPRATFVNLPSPVSPPTTLKSVTVGGAVFARPPPPAPATTTALPPESFEPPAATAASASALDFKPRASGNGVSTARRFAFPAKLPAGGSKTQAVALASAAQGAAREAAGSEKMGTGAGTANGPHEDEVERLRERFWGKGGEQESGPLDRLYQPVNLEVRLNKLRTTDSSFSSPAALSIPSAPSLLRLLSAYPKPPRHRLPALQIFPTVHATPALSAQLPSADRRIAFALDYLFGRSVSDGECVFLEKREKALWGYVRVMAGVAEVNERVRAAEERGRSGRGWMERG